MQRDITKTFPSFGLPVTPMSYCWAQEMQRQKRQKKFSAGLLNTLPAWPWDFSVLAGGERWLERAARAGSWKGEQKHSCWQECTGWNCLWDLSAGKYSRKLKWDPDLQQGCPVGSAVHQREVGHSSRGMQSGEKGICTKWVCVFLTPIAIGSCWCALLGDGILFPKKPAC